MIENRLTIGSGSNIELKVNEDSDLNMVLITDHSGETVAVDKRNLTDLVSTLDKIDNGN